MLRYACATAADLKRLRRRGGPLTGVRLRPSLDAAQKGCKGRILVVDGVALSEGATRADVQASAVLNLDPYLPPKAVTAGGGYVVRPGDDEPDVLLIYRRGVWDLPKGKRDEGESVEACALREVREEVGIEEALEVVEPLGTTVHAYPEKGAYRIKTTHWFLMRTSQARFTPQTSEGIEEVAWVPWAEAKRRVGFATLRRHMEAVEARIFATPLSRPS